MLSLKLSKILPLSIVLAILLVGCTGAGRKATSEHAYEIYSDQTLIFVKRNTGFYSGANLVTVSANNSQSKDLGTKESVSFAALEGENTLSVEWKGLGQLGATEKTVDLSKGDKAFFIISMNVNLTSIDLKLYQVDRTDFMNE